MRPWMDNGGFLTYPPEDTVRRLPLPEAHVIALAYWRHQRAQVMDTGLSMLGSWAGRHRSGKSVWASTAGYLMDPTFWPNYEERVIRDHRQFLDVWEGIDRKKIYGAVVQVDEAGVSMGSDDWYETWLKEISKMMQMFGYLRPVVFFCAPLKNLVASKIRNMFQNYYEVQRFSRKYSVLSPYDMGYNAFKNKPMYKHPRLTILDRKIYVSRITLHPPEFILERYQALEGERKPEMLKSFKEEVLRSEAQGQKREVDLDKAIDYVTKNIKLFEGERSKPDNPIVNAIHVSFFFKVPSRTAQYIADMAKRRIKEGYKVKMEGVQ